jgi:putative transposase
LEVCGANKTEFVICDQAIDITYLATHEGWLYLAVVLELFARRVVGWSMQPTLERHLVLAALRHALAGRRPPAGLIHHSDRGGLSPGRVRPWAARSARA